MMTGHARNENRTGTGKGVGRPGRTRRLITVAVAALVSLLLVVIAGCDRPETAPEVDIVQALSRQGDLACYQKADRPVTLRFPEDAGAHPGFKTEWWYYTGHLETQGGREFGFQLTFFRQALDCDPSPGASAWRTRQLYFAHFALTDMEGKAFYAVQRTTRGSLGLAGAQADPFRVWMDDWSAADKDGGTLRLTARDRAAPKGSPLETDFSLTLDLTRTKPMIRQGQEGWSRKGREARDASYYYSLPGLAAQGRVGLGQETFPVTGRAWFDHEWSTAALGSGVQGWDWFALHLASGPLAGTDLMVCQVRQAAGPPVKFGSLSLPDGAVKILEGRDFSITPLAEWTSPGSGKTYPSRWRIRLPDPVLPRGLDLEVDPMLPDQEHGGGLVYYEGAVRVSGPDTGNTALSGRGYVEMTGY